MQLDEVMKCSQRSLHFPVVIMNFVFLFLHAFLYAFKDTFQSSVQSVQIELKGENMLIVQL